MSAITRLQLNDGHHIPQFGLGVWQTPAEETAQVVKTALDLGYRHIDTAAIYGNEEGVGKAIAQAGLPRDELFVTTKLWNADQGYDSALRAFDASLAKLGLEYVDLYLIHWPLPERQDYVETWKGLVQLQQQGLARSIGVSNFKPNHLQAIIEATGVTPAVNQVEIHPTFTQRSLVAEHDRLGIGTEAWSPLGQAEDLENEVIGGLAEKLGKTPAQVILRWHLQRQHIVFPKSVTPSRIEENFRVFDFELSEDDLAAIDGLDAGNRIGPDPDEMN